MFKNREDAAGQLSQKLLHLKNEAGIVLAIPRGGVPLGYIIARELGFKLEVLLSKKIGHPFSSEYAIGSVTLHGIILDESVRGFWQEYIEEESMRILRELKEKFKSYTGNGKPMDLKDKTVILVDDGIATGNTLLAAIAAVRKSAPKKIVVAAPVCPPETTQKIKIAADEFICLEIPADFYGVGQFYYDFSPVSDEEVIRLLGDIKEAA